MSMSRERALAVAPVLIMPRLNMSRILHQLRGHTRRCRTSRKIRPTPMKTRITPRISPVAIAIALFFAVALLAHGATITVTNTNDSGPGSLRQALAIANDGDTITFAITGTIGLTSGELLVDKSITISGPGANRLSIGSVQELGSPATFHVVSGKTVTISGLTITGHGGGILNDEAVLTVSNCIVSGT